MHANKYNLQLLKPEAEGAKGVGTHSKRIVQFCQASAVPMHAREYRGMVGVPAVQLAAQFCILFSLVHVLDLFVHKVEGGQSASHRYVKMAIAFLILLVYICTAWDDFGDSTATSPAYRWSGTYTHSSFNAMNCVVVFGLVLVLIVEFVYEYIGAYSAVEGSGSGPKFLHTSTMAQVVDRVGADVPMIIGFGLLGMCVLLHAAISNSTSVLGGVFILFTAGFVQHISNVVKILYESMCGRLSSEIVVGMTLHDESAAKRGVTDNAEVAEILKAVHLAEGTVTDQPALDKVNTQVRLVLQFFGWTRLYLFLFVVALACSFFTFAKDAPMGSSLQTFNDSHVLYFTVCFCLAHIGFDTMYELMPVAFSNVHSDILKLYFVCAYLACMNLVQINYMYGMEYTANT